MWAFSLILLAFVVAGGAAAHLFRRRRPKLAEAIGHCAYILLQVDVGLIFGWTALGAAREGGTLLLVLAVLWAVLAVTPLAGPCLGV